MIRIIVVIIIWFDLLDVGVAEWETVRPMAHFIFVSVFFCLFILVSFHTFPCSRAFIHSFSTFALYLFIWFLAGNNFFNLNEKSPMVWLFLRMFATEQQKKKNSIVAVVARFCCCYCCCLCVRVQMIVGNMILMVAFNRNHYSVLYSFCLLDFFSTSPLHVHVRFFSLAVHEVSSDILLSTLNFSYQL